MKLIEVSKTLRTPAEKGAATMIFRPGQRYLLHDDEAAAGQAAGALKSVSELPAAPERFDAGRHDDASVVFPFVGGYGDAVSCIPVLRAMKRHRPAVRLTVAATPGPQEIFTLGEVDAELVRYPITERQFGRFDAYLTLESAMTGDLPGPAGFGEFFARGLGVPFEEQDRKFAIQPPDHPAVEMKASGRPRVALAVSGGSALRDWPIRNQLACVEALVQLPAEVYLIGTDSGPVDWPHQPPLLNNLVGKTGQIDLLAAWLGAMDLLIAGDSFLMHLAGAMEIPVAAIFACTSANHAGAYDGVKTLSSAAACAPCGQAVGACPQGLAGCPAMHDPAVGAERVVSAVEQMIRDAGERRFGQARAHSSSV